MQHKSLRQRKLTAGLVILATACSSGSGTGKSLTDISKKLTVIDAPKKDSILRRENSFNSPGDSSIILPPDYNNNQIPVMCYDEPAEPMCYDIAEPPAE